MFLQEKLISTGLQSSRGDRARREGRRGAEDQAAARGGLRHERHRHRRDLLDPGRHSERLDQPAQPLHAFAGRARELEGPEADSGADGGVRAVAEEGRGIQGADIARHQTAGGSQHLEPCVGQ